jgi:hypothetical protein
VRNYTKLVTTRSSRLQVEGPPVSEIPKDRALHDFSRGLVDGGLDLSHHGPALALGGFFALGVVLLGSTTESPKAHKPAATLLEGRVEADCEFSFLGTPVSQHVFDLAEFSQFPFGGRVRPEGLDDGINGLLGVLLAGLGHPQSRVRVCVRVGGDR